MSIKSTPLVKSKSVQDLVDLCLRGPGLVRHFGTGENIVLHLQFFGKKEGWTHWTHWTHLPVIPSTMSACRTHLHLDLGALRLAYKQMKRKDRSPSAFQILGSLPQGLLEL